MAAPAGQIPITTSFYKKNDFFDVCNINGSKFALFSKPLTSRTSITLDLSDYNIIFLKPVDAEGDVKIRAVTVVALASLISKEGEMNIEASGKIVTLGSKIESKKQCMVSGDKGVYPCAIITSRLEMILEHFDEGISDEHGPTIVEALMYAFDAVVDPEAKDEDISLPKAFEFFDIPTST